MMNQEVAYPTWAQVGFKVAYQISEGVAVPIPVDDLEFAIEGWKVIKNDKFVTIWSHEEWGTIIATK